MPHCHSQWSQFERLRNTSPVLAAFKPHCLVAATCRCLQEDFWRQHRWILYCHFFLWCLRGIKLKCLNQAFRVSWLSLIITDRRRQNGKQHQGKPSFRSTQMLRDMRLSKLMMASATRVTRFKNSIHWWTSSWCQGLHHDHPSRWHQRKFCCRDTKQPRLAEIDF